MMRSFMKPTEQVSWEQVMAAVPDEAAAFKTALAEADMDLEDFCIRWEEACPEGVFDVWERLAHRFRSATGLELSPYDERSNDGDVGLLVVGAWRLSAAGRRFFGIKDAKLSDEHAAKAAGTGTAKRLCDIGWDEQADCMRLDPEDDLVETVLVEQDSRLLDRDAGSHALRIRIAMNSGMLIISARGYGEAGADDGHGDQVCMELYEGELRLHVFPDIRDENPVTISLEGAREDRRPPE